MSGFFGGVGIGPQAIGRSGAPPDPVPVAGAELLVNVGFEGAYVGGVAPGWSLTGSSVTLSEENSVVHGGTAAQKIVTSAITAAGVSQSIAGKLATGGWYAWSICSYRVAPNAHLYTQLYDGAVVRAADAAASMNTWINQIVMFRSSGTGGYVRQISYDRAQTFYSDDFSLVPLTLASLISARAYASADCDLSAAITRTAGTQAGFVARLDSASSPANFIIAYLDGVGNVKVDKCVAGTYTNIISGAVTYGSAKRLRLVCSGTSVSAYYDGTQVGSTVTVSDAGIVSNVRHGKFSTYASNTFSGYVAA